MSYSEINEKDIENLRKKLEPVKLSETDRSLFEAIFSAAKDWIKLEDDSVEAESTVARLRRQLTQSFFPGPASGFAIVVTKVSPPPPKVSRPRKVSPPPPKVSPPPPKVSPPYRPPAES